MEVIKSQKFSQTTNLEESINTFLKTNGISPSRVINIIPQNHDYILWYRKE
ncbi:hypothetical protein [Winogradskyella pulchriflava]|uniref:Uncharacterized protein n=1 Tax=Winogradskyella pulchriflava TaxID=1110688 RepID=A0ABV6QCD1_9FLAO